MILVVDAASGRLRDAGAATLGALGYATADLASLDVGDVLPGIDVNALLATAGGQHVPLQLRNAAGSTIDVSAEITRIADANLFVVSWRPAQQVDQTQALLEQAWATEERFRNLLETAPDAIMTFDHDGYIRMVNRKAEELFGYARGDLIGHPVEMLLPERVRAAHKSRRTAYSADPHTRPMGTGLELYAQHRAGHEFSAEVSLSPLRIGPDLLITAVVRDITDRQRVQEELARSNAELEQFAYVVSHDLQEPLRMVASYVQLLARRYQGKLGADADEFIHYAVDGANRMRDLINDLLTYSRVGRRGGSMKSTDIEQVFARTLQNLRLAIDESAAVVTHDPLPTLTGDPLQLGELFQNLISNAIKFRRDEAPRIHVGVQAQDKHWLFTVRDNGIGIAPEYFERIFLIFQRLHSRDEYPGTGIGLAICKKIVEYHKGRIWLESAAGHGTTFFFTLPR